MRPWSPASSGPLRGSVPLGCPCTPASAVPEAGSPSPLPALPWAPTTPEHPHPSLTAGQTLPARNLGRSLVLPRNYPEKPQFRTGALTCQTPSCSLGTKDQVRASDWGANCPEARAWEPCCSAPSSWPLARKAGTRQKEGVSGGQCARLRGPLLRRTGPILMQQD